jgi:hypothetical protein
MSQRELEAVIGRAIVDQEFRVALFANPTATLDGYELTEAEAAALRLVDAESLDACGNGLARRILNMLTNKAPDLRISNGKENML